MVWVATQLEVDCWELKLDKMVIIIYDWFMLTLFNSILATTEENKADASTASVLRSENSH